ncbi:TIR domain-containing protein [Micromonospora chalcea]
MDDPAYTYDVAVSFAGEQRAYAERFVRACEGLGLKVFYDRNMTTELWGRNLILEFRKTYGGAQPRFFVPFISNEYLVKPYPKDEFNAALEQAQQRPDVYILPVLVGDVSVPRELLGPAIAYLQADDHSPAELADRLAAKLKETRANASAPLRAPRLAPTSFAPRAMLESALDTVESRFRRSAAATLEPFGYSCEVGRDELGVDIRVTRAGEPACSLSLWFDVNGVFRDRDRLSMSFGWPSGTRHGVNGWVSAVWDRQAGLPKVQVTDLSLGGNEQVLPVDEFVEALWGKIIDYLERRAR